MDTRRIGSTVPSERPIRTTARSGLFSPELLAFRRSAGPPLPPQATERVLEALRGTVLSCFDRAIGVPEWISGHQPGGLPTRQVHLATLPLIGRGIDAKGDSWGIVGAALAIPQHVPEVERLFLFARLSARLDRDAALTLRLGNLGSLRLTGPEPLDRFDDASLAGLVEPEREWASMTPVVLHRFPKRKPVGSSAWRAEIESLIREACRHAEVPDPQVIRFDVSSFVPGLPDAARSQDAFPSLASRVPGAPKPQLHVRLTFTEPVVGPLVLGLGKYRGFGLCRPVTETPGWRSRTAARGS